MAQVIHHVHDDQRTDPGSGLGFIIGIILAVIAVVLFFMYAFPYLRGGTQQQTQPNINIERPIPVPQNTGGAVDETTVQ